MIRKYIIVFVTIICLLTFLNGCIEDNKPSVVTDFTYEPLYPKAKEKIFFNSTSHTLNREIINWSWDFGDGNISFGENVTHQYYNVDTYDVRLTITDDVATHFKERKITAGINASLNDLSISISDLNDTYTPQGEEYISDPYVVPSGELLEGRTVVEKYLIGFVLQDKVIIQQLGRLQSIADTEEYLNLIKPFYSSMGYNLLSTEKYGDESYAAVFEEEDEVNYVISFRIKDLVIAIETVNEPLDLITDLASILEEKILKSISNDYEV